MTPVEHDKSAPPLPAHTVPWWEDGLTLPEVPREPTFLIAGIMGFWRQVRSWLLYPLASQDPLTCSPSMLGLLAWERDITRFDGEPMDLYRKRVKWAYLNARDAGDVAGFKRIFERLGLGWCELHERQADTDWDVITVEVTDSDAANNQALMMELIQHYGRTCRRYRFQVVYPQSATVHAARIDMSQQVFGASLKRTS
jgi:hypothetical protein